MSNRQIVETFANVRLKELSDEQFDDFFKDELPAEVLNYLNKQ